MTTQKRHSAISRDEFLEYTKSVWTFPAESARKVGHPAPFPEELPRRRIALYTYADDVVLDPFMGSGTEAVAAMQLSRSYVGSGTVAGVLRQYQSPGGGMCPTRCLGSTARLNPLTITHAPGHASRPACSGRS